jgi:glycerophosphoryl diester phosphodiesterase
MTWPYPKVIAHRGGGTLAPENTLAGIKKGVALGFHGVEFDVKLANYATPILLHDDTLERTTSGKGLARNFNYAELSKLDAGSWFAKEFAGEPIPLFETVAAFLIGHGVWANVEIKPCQGRDDITGETVALAARELWQGGAQQPLLSSFSIAALRSAKAAAPELPRGWIVREVPETWLQTMQELGCTSLHCRFRTLSRDLAQAVRDAGFGLMVWTVNDPVAAREALSWGANAIVTDRLDLIAPDFH